MTQAHVRTSPHKAMSVLASMPDCYCHTFVQTPFKGLPSSYYLKASLERPPFKNSLETPSRHALYSLEHIPLTFA